MKKIILLVFSVSVSGMIGFSVMAQEDTKEPVASSVQAEISKRTNDVPAKPATKKKTLKKKKSKAPKSVSEYKFTTQDTQPAYKFDKEGNPIIKNGKLEAGGAKKTTGQAIPKLTTTANAGKSAARYVCPMGAYEGDKPGKCPKCGMTLVEKK